ncbi:MAG TPA: hypothetical protein VMG31_09835 [Verrucomicrobiae bacterium]|nr:hypothetical protein [Verrucomicrobiae bacterium]
MKTKSGPEPGQNANDAITHIANARQILKDLQEKIGKNHPELGAAITKLEMALNILAIETGGLL